MLWHVLSDGGAIARDGAGVHDECDRFGVRQILLELVANPRVSRNVNQSYSLLDVWEDR